MDPVCTGAQPHGLDQLVYVPAGPTRLTGCLSIPIGARGIVLFAHGSGSSRQSVRNRFVAGELQSAGLATLLFDLLTPEEGILDEKSRQFRFDIGLLASRLSVAAAWIARIPATRSLRVGYFGASTGASAALTAAALHPERVRAVVSRGGRPDLAECPLESVCVPTLLIVGGCDHPVIEINQEALTHLREPKELVIVSRATHLFEEAGALEEVAKVAKAWFLRYLPPDAETIIPRAR